MTDVPSNLIPTRVTQLPIAPVADENSLMMIVYQGNNYQIRVGDLLSVAGVPTSRQVIAGTGLTGGGQLSSNVTLSVANGGIGTTQLASSGVTPGVYGTATDIPVFTVDETGRVTAATTIPATISGYVPTTRQVIAGDGLSGGGALNTNVTLTANLSNSTPLATFQAGSAGTSSNMSRADHKHPAVNLAIDDEIDGILGLGNGGTAKSIVPDEGAIIWCGADGLYVGPVGAAGQMLQSNGAGEYLWVNQSSLNVGQADNLNGGAAYKVVYQTAPDTTGFVDAPVSADTFLKWNGSALVWDAVAGAGTVTSVNASGGTTGFSFTGGPITAAGTLTMSGTLIVPNGGTGLSSYTAGDLLYYNAGDAFSKLSIGSANRIMTSTGSAPQWTIPSTITVGTATNVAGGAANKIVYNTSSGVSSFVDAPVSSNTYLQWTGSAFSWAAPPGVTSVDVSGGTTGLTTSGGPVTSSGTITLAGTLAVANGGTGATTAPNARTNLSAAASGANSDITSMTGVTGGISSPDFIQFDAAASVTDATAKLYYNNSDQYKTLAFQMNGSAVQKIGEEQYFRVKLSASATAGQVMMFTGTLGSSGGLTAAPATGLTPIQANYVLGLAVESGSTNDWIFVTFFGEVKNINTTGGAESWVSGQTLYYNPSVTGGLTKTKPTAPNAIVIVAAVVHVGTSNGILFVRPTYGTVLGGTDGNVNFTSLSNGDVITYDGSGLYWKNVAQSTLSVGSATTATTATNVAGGAAGSIIYQTGASITASLALGAAGYVLTAGASAPEYVAPSTLTVGTATNATNVATTAVSVNTAYYPSFVASTSGNNGVCVDVDMTYNPSTNTMTVVNLTATGGITGGTF
jgi:hypothetical protein